MIKHYFLTALRNLLKTKVFALINILGLAVGMAACLLILHYINYQKSYDTFHQNSDQIYRLRYERTSDKGTTQSFASCTPPAAPRLRNNYPEVEKIARIIRFKASISYLNNKYFEERIYFAEPDFLDILKFKFISGDPLNGIREPNKAFISQSTARKYYGDQDPMGKRFSLDKKVDFEVAGVFQDIPPNSHLKFDFLLSYINIVRLWGDEYQKSWGHTGAFTYLIFKKGADPKAFEEKLQPMIKQECPWLKEYKMTLYLRMQPLRDIHLTSHYMQEYEVNGNVQTIQFLSLIVLLIIIIAWVNYINLSTAQSLSRAKEVGLRKVVGATRRHLVRQFFQETFLINLLAMVLALVITQIALPPFNQLTGTPPDFSFWAQPWLWPIVIMMLVAGVLISGFYPVAALSSFKPVTVLKGRLSHSASGVMLRKGLVLFQYVMAIILIGGTLIVFKQISYLRSQDLGVDIEQMLIFRSPRVRPPSAEERFKTFKDTLTKEGLALRACHVSEVPGKQLFWDHGAIRPAGTSINYGKNYKIMAVDYDFIKVFDLKLAKGRFFSQQFPADKNNLLLNEAGIKWMGFRDADSALHQKVNYWDKIYTIIGVIKNYHHESLKEDYEPIIYRLMPTGQGPRGLFAVKVTGPDIPHKVGRIEDLYHSFFPGNPFDYFFLDDYYNRQYQGDEMFGTVFAIFAMLAIFIQALGIFGLSIYSSAQRTREISIRKVVGATVAGLQFLLTWEYLKLIGLSFLAAIVPLVLIMNGWLSGFANRIGFSLTIFILPLLVVTVITLFTVSWHTIRSATANPADVLRHE